MIYVAYAYLNSVGFGIFSSLFCAYVFLSCFLFGFKRCLITSCCFPNHEVRFELWVIQLFLYSFTFLTIHLLSYHVYPLSFLTIMICFPFPLNQFPAFS